MEESKDTGQPAPRRTFLLHAVKAVITFLLGSIVFGIAYTQPTLYYSNQNQYFLHGLARGGLGYLDADWLANTADPTPVFSALVAFTYRYLNESLFYVYYILLLGAYGYVLNDIFTFVSGGRPTGRARLGFLTALVVLHCGLLRWSSAQLFGVDYPWYFQAGIANQYILGPGLQPSAFGVLLLLSVSTFLRDRPLGAVTWSSLAAVLHSTYLLSAAFFTLSYLYLLYREKRGREAVWMGLWALVVVAPVLVYNLVTFAPSSPEAFAQAQELLAHFRIPHHAEPDRWLDGIACAQIGWIVAAMFLVRRSKLFAILVLPFAFSLVVTLVQLVTHNDTLALLFPWRTSSLLVPLATAIILARLVNRFAVWFPHPSLGMGRAFKAGCVVVLAVSVAGGAAINWLGWGYRTNQEELPLLEWVRDHKAAGEIYLLPVEVPKLASGKRGAASLNFTPPPRRAKQGQLISIDLQRFRLFTGAPIFIDFKSIPYKDVEVLDWHERVGWNQKLYEQRDWNDAAIKAELARRHITHVVTAACHDVRCNALDLVYEDGSYRVYRLRLNPAE